MARAFDPHTSDEALRSQRQMDDEWCASLRLIRKFTEEEKQAESDRALAARIAGVTIDLIPEEIRKSAMLQDDYDDESDDEINKTESTPTTNISINVSHASTIQELQCSRRQSKKCASCFDPVNRSDPCLPCGHVYDLKCLKQLFMAAMGDESLMPPRCCSKEIPVELARLTTDEESQFSAKMVEYSTANRLYCSQPTCSTFIPPTCIIGQIGTCPNTDCKATTCVICKGPTHTKQDCPMDNATQVILDEARKAGWARCYKCRTLIELTQGCYHMTCRCRAEFCYLCATPWKNCTCVQWDETRLYEEALRHVERVPVTQAIHLNPINNYTRVQHVINQLRANYECRHTGRWIYRRGGGRCEECNHYLPHYLFRCPSCQFLACNRCRRNRF